MNENNLDKFQKLLRTLLQFDSIDLDFGIYRILNYKREYIEDFISERLPKIVDETFAEYAVSTSEDMVKEVEDLKKKIIVDWGPDAFNGTGQLKLEIRDKPIGKKYLAVEEKIKSSQVAEDLKTRVYNDLFTFFSRYYEDGDFISKRRYGRRETYAIPYNGEEVTLYWANRDQYYVKTGDRFKAYRFKADDYSVAFEIRNISPEQNGNSGKKRYFLLAHEASITWNEQKKTLAIAFEYRPLIEAEEKEHGRTEQQKPQDSLNEAAVRTILELIIDGNLKVILAKPEGTNGLSLLHNHLTRFSRRNTADFFIHKDLRSFLSRELDFFIKNEALLLDELIAGGEEDLRAHVKRGRVVRQVAEAIIEFLAQVEDFQKRLWEKRKFVLRTEYCLTIDRVPEELWDEVLANKAQITEWRQLYALDDLMKTEPLLNKSLNRDFLKTHPTLVIDTRHFPEGFKWQLLSHFDDLDEDMDGILIKSDNWQALNLLADKYREKVKCVHIDPPYNTAVSGFLYKNNYQHSSWLSMMCDRITASISMLTDDGDFFCHIDENEYERLHTLLSQFFASINTAVWDKLNPMMGAQELAIQHEYVVLCSDRPQPFMVRPENVRLIMSMANSIIQQYGGPGEQASEAFRESVRKAPGLSGGERAYQYLDNKARVYRLAAMGWPNPKPPPPQFFEPLIHPMTGKPCPVPARGWANSPDTMKRLIKSGNIIFGPDETTQPQKKVYLSKEKALSSVIRNGSRGKNDLQELGFDFDYSHPVTLYVTLLDAGLGSKADQSIVVDYFAGSGTTAQAVIALNRQDEGKRKYILVELDAWFETIMLPRIKKVVFCEKWKDGKPQGGPGISHMFKYQYVEQYEDTLHNLELPRAAAGRKMLELFRDEYLLKYMLDFETQGSASLLNLDMFKDPFAYNLKVQEGDEIVERPVDLVETFNYLLGIQVNKMMALQDNGRLYRAVLGHKNGKRTAIVWRSVVGLEDNEKALMKDKAFIEKMLLPALLGEAKQDRLLVNGASFVKDAETTEPEFKRLMFAPVGV